jgi:peptidoglycan/LPS O-acetylase OafA/YrhL
MTAPTVQTAPRSTSGRLLAWCGGALTVGLNFLRERTRESSTRLCAVMLCVTGCVCALATVAFPFLHPDQALTVTAMVAVSTALIASGCVAIINRSREPGDVGAGSGGAGA